jgi:hypothetical protein
MMQNTFRHRIGVSLMCGLLALIVSPSATRAQSGSAGGNIGNDDKSLSGSRSAEPERPAGRSNPDAE